MQQFDQIRGGSEIARYDEFDARQAISDYLVMQSGRSVKSPHPLVEHFDERRMRLVDLAAVLADRTGGRFDPYDTRAATASFIGTGHFASVLADWGGIEARAVLDRTAEDVRSVATPIELDDYRPAKFPIVSLSSVPELDDDPSIVMSVVTAAGGEPIRVKGRTVKLAFSRELLENDDRSVFAASFRAFGAQVGRRLGRDFASILSTNANMTDGAGLFSATAGNDLTSGAITAASVGASLAALRDRTSPDGEYYNAAGASLIVGTAHEAAAREIVKALYHSDDPARLRVIASPWLSGSYFYLCADQQSAPSIALATLSGGNGTLFSMRPSARAPASASNIAGSSARESFDGTAVDCHIAFGLAAVARNIVRNTTA